MTDKIEDFDLLKKYFPFYKDRLLVEVFSVGAYFSALEKGINYPMLCIDEVTDLYKSMSFILDGHISMITVHLRAKVGEVLDIFELLHDRGVNIFAFSSTDQEYIQRNLGTRFTAIYSYNVLPRDID